MRARARPHRLRRLRRFTDTPDFVYVFAFPPILSWERGEVPTSSPERVSSSFVKTLRARGSGSPPRASQGGLISQCLPASRLGALWIHRMAANLGPSRITTEIRCHPEEPSQV